MSETGSNERLKGPTKEYLSKETLKDSLKSLASIRHRFTRSMVFSFGALALIVVIAALVRLLPLQWGFYLTEFDPYWQYHQMQYILSHGFLAWFSWHDPTVWYPWGRDVAATSYPGLPLAGAALYMVLNAVGSGLSSFDVAVVWPVLLGVLTVLLIYVFGRDVGGSKVGLFAALFLALAPAFVNRTSLGFFDNDSLGIFLIILVAILFLRSLDSRRTLRGTVVYAVAGGLALGYLQVSWGSAVYVLGLLGLFAFVLVVFKRYSRRLLVSYGVTMGIAFMIAVQAPRVGVGFLTGGPALGTVGVAVLLCMMEFTRGFATRLKVASFSIFAVLLAASYLLLQHFGLVTSLVGKYLAILDPFVLLTNPIIMSVAEQNPTPWASFYIELGTILFVAPVGFYFLLRRRNVRDIFLVLFGVTMIYFASSQIRLEVILDPALAMLAAVAISGLLIPFVNIARETVIFDKKRRFVPKVSKEFGAVFIIILLLLAFIPLSRAVSNSDIPATLAVSTLPVRPNATSYQYFGDWIQALAFMRNNLPANAVVAAWWDYGYWITIGGNHTTVCDNGTTNETQIALIGRMFLSNETQAIKILKSLNVTHVVVFVTWYSYTSSTTGYQDVKFYGFGEDSKWRWMARIAGLNETALLEPTTDSSGNSYGIPNADTVLGKLIWDGIGGSPVTTYTAPQHFNLIFESSNRWVLVYQVNYTGTS